MTCLPIDDHQSMWNGYLDQVALNLNESPKFKKRNHILKKSKCT